MSRSRPSLRPDPPRIVAISSTVAGNPSGEVPDVQVKGKADSPGRKRS